MEKALDNNSRTKKLRKEVAQKILQVFLTDLSPVYLDESSFNIFMRPSYAWGKRGQVLSGKRPIKSINYSLLAAMDINGIIGWMVFQGSVKKEDFFAFMMELVKRYNHTLWKDTNPVFFMDNANIHKSKDFMQKTFNNFFTTLYNAPYSPQLNPIEYCFSKIKTIVRKAKVNTEKQLLKAIHHAIGQVTPRDCAGFVIETFKYLRPAFHKGDFI